MFFKKNLKINPPNSDSAFWDGLSGVYHKMFDNTKAYQKMYSLMRESMLPDMRVLEIGTASGLVARAVADKVREVQAIDYSEKMIAKARVMTERENIHFSVQDATNLDFEDRSFDVVIIAAVLHIIPNPEEVLKEIDRVLKDGGLLIAPTFMWKERTLRGKIQQFFMKLKNFPIYSVWNSAEYLEFLRQNGFECVRCETIPASFNICYAELRKCNTVG